MKLFVFAKRCKATKRKISIVDESINADGIEDV